MPDQPAWRRYLRLLGPDVRRDVDDELSFHLETRAAEHVSRGVPPEEARRRAVAEFGDLARARAECEAIGTRELRRARWREALDGVGRDMRHATRLLRRAPAFTTVAVLTLALGIGATTAIFSIVHGVLLRPLPFGEPDRVVRVWETSPRGERRNVVSPGNYVDWSARVRTLDALGAYRLPDGRTLLGDGEPVQVMTTDITPSVLRVLGRPPARGRPFVDDDMRDGRAVLVSDRFWRTRLGAREDVVGRPLVLDDVTYTVVGVMPADFAFPTAASEVWRALPSAEIDANERRSHNWLVVGRLAPGATIERARSEMSTIAAGIAREHPESMQGWGVNVVAFHEDVVSPVRSLLLVLLGGAVVVLLVACANLANLLLARALAREREMAVRLALGAGRGRLVRQLLTESLVLAMVGSTAGLVIAPLLLRGLVRYAPADLPRLEAVGIQAPVFAFAGAITVACTLLFGLVPALRVAGTELQATLRASNDRTGGVRHARLRGALLVGEVALSLVLLVGAGLLVRSAQRLAHVDLGYRSDGVAAIQLDLPRARYPETERHVAFFAALEQRLRAVPGVAAVGATTEPPASGFNMTFSFAIEGRPARNPSGREDPQPVRVVTPEYFRTLAIPLRHGRAFTDADRADTRPVVIVDEALARLHWPGEDPIGRRISFVGAQGPWFEIVGVVGDTRMRGLDQPADPALYLPHAQKRWPWMSWLTMVVRAEPGRDPAALSAALRAVVWEQDPALGIQALTTLERLNADSVARRRFAMTLLIAFATLSLVLGMVGMYGVLSYTVAQRSREIGIRMALGADAARVRGVMLRQALLLTGAGIAIGGVGALALSRVLGSLLYEVSPADPVTFSAVTVLLVLVAAVAAWLPARRATRVDPLVVLREG
jgi:putative ABC transport system permease protein